MLHDVDEEAIDDVEVENGQEVQDDEEGGLLDADTREPDDREDMEQTREEVDTQGVSADATVKSAKRNVTRIGSEEKLYPCNQPNCNKTFKHMFKLSRHIRLVHKKERPHPCKQKGCLKKFGTKTHLDRHVASVHLQ